MAMVRSLRLPVWKYIQVSPENDDLHLLPKAILNNIAGKLNGTITASFLDEMEWTGVEYVYYTEADQILYARYVIRSVELLEGLKGSAALVPHRMQVLHRCTHSGYVCIEICFPLAVPPVADRI